MRHASCQCGQLQVTCTGEPVRISVCHCLECQKRSGAPFAAQARYPAGQVTVSGDAQEWTRVGDSGTSATFRFCPRCGSTVWFGSGPDPDTIAVPIGAFADPSFPAPRVTVYEERRHPWVHIVAEGIEHD